MNEQELAKALRRLNDATVPPPVDPARETALMAAFDAASAPPRGRGNRGVRRMTRRGYWPMVGLAAAAAVLVAIALPRGSAGHRAAGPPSSSRDVQVGVSEFVAVPGAASLPPIESGSLVRVDLPISVLPSLGVTPPATSVVTVKADLVIGQDGLTRAVRLVN
jgi:hypothetical protein